MVYLDSAILVKLFTDEPDSEHWRNLLQSRPDLGTSKLAYPEMRRALRQKTVSGSLKRDREGILWREFLDAAENGGIQTFPLGDDVINESVLILQRMSRTIPLRTLDALHLATARLFKCSAVATTDLRMRAAAGELAMKLL